MAIGSLPTSVGSGLPATLLLVVPSRAAAAEWPRRLVRKTGAACGLLALTVKDLAHRLAEPALLDHGQVRTPTGFEQLEALRLLEEGGRLALRLSQDAPLPPVAQALSRTLRDLRLAGVTPTDLRALARVRAREDRRRLVALSTLAAAHQRALEGNADEATCLIVAARPVPSLWVKGADLLLVGHVDLSPLELDVLETLAHWTTARAIESTLSPAVARALASRGFALVDWAKTPLREIAPPNARAGVQRLRDALFEPAPGSDARDSSVLFETAPGEAAEVRSLARRVLAEASREVSFGEMAILVPGVHPYVPLVTDLFDRLGIPHEVLSPGPLRCGRCARSLELLLRCRGLDRRIVLEFLSFAPLPLVELLGPGATLATARWEYLSREAGIVAGLDAWIAGLRALAEGADERALQADTGDAERLRARVKDAEALLRLVELLSGTLDALSGTASWAEWSARLVETLDQWMAPQADRAALVEVIRSLALGGTARLASWSAFEAALFASLDATPLPVTSPRSGAVQIGTYDDLLGLPFRIVLLPGLVEGGFPGVLQPDPFLLDAERVDLDELRRKPDNAAPKAGEDKQLLLFPEPRRPIRTLDTTHDRLLLTRERFRAAVSQASEKVILTFPRADPRTGRERLPSLFFVAAASALVGHPIGSAELATLVVEADPRDLAPALCLDRSERDRARVWRGGQEAAAAIAVGCAPFRRSRLAERARMSPRLTEYDGLLEALPADLRRRLDPTAEGRTVSSTRLAAFGRCGFLYFLESVLGLRALEEPDARVGLDPLQKGIVFHAVAERFLRGLKASGVWPPKADAEEARVLDSLLVEELDRALVTHPIRHPVLRHREARHLFQMLLDWLQREARRGDDARPLHLEVSFDDAGPYANSVGPIQMKLRDGSSLPLSGRIDRIDAAKEGGLILRDYKTGQAPRRAGDPSLDVALAVQLPLYVVAARQMFPNQRIVAAVCDYVADRGQVRRLDDIEASLTALARRLEETVASLRLGLFLQEPAACEHCAFDIVCGPRGMVAYRKERKAADVRARRGAPVGGRG